MQDAVPLPQTPAAPAKRTRKKMSTLARSEARWGYFFLLPFIVGVLGFTLLPMIATFAMTFTNFKIGEPLQGVGLANYKMLFTDRMVAHSLGVTIRYGLIALPIGLILPLALAILLNSPYVASKSVFRTLFYFPYVIPFIAAIFVWMGLLNPETGWINNFLRWVGVENPPNWLNDPRWVYPALVILGLWGIGNAMLINLASLQGVPTELYDAAKIDGAGWWATLRSVTLPMISPVIFYNLVLSVVGLFQYFLVPLAINNGTGQPGGSTMFFNLYLYKTFFTYQNMAMGATMAWALFLIVLVVTIILFRTSRYWVYYAGDNR